MPFRNKKHTGSGFCCHVVCNLRTEKRLKEGNERGEKDIGGDSTVYPIKLVILFHNY